MTLLGCPAKDRSWRGLVHDQGYWPQKTPDAGLLLPGTVVVILRDNPVEFRRVCSPEAWGVTAAATETVGLAALSNPQEFSARVNADIKKAVEGKVGANYENKNLVDITDVVLAEHYTGNLHLDGAYATESCRAAVQAELDRNLAVSIVLGTFRSTVKFSSELSTGAGADLAVQNVVAGTLGFNSRETIAGTGASLVWGIKYMNIGKLGPAKPLTTEAIPHCTRVEGRKCSACEVKQPFDRINSGGDNQHFGTLPVPPSCEQMIPGVYNVTIAVKRHEELTPLRH
jgi:hypothetical protein